MTAPSLNVYIQGQGSVDADNLNTFEQTCDNVADLRAFVGTVGLQVFIRGLVSPADGGQGPFYWNPTGTGPDDGGITNVVPTNAGLGCWTRIPISGGGGGGANGLGSYVVLGSSNAPVNARVLGITGSSLGLTDNGAGSSVLLGTSALSGDITTSANSFITSIASHAVTYAKIQQASPQTLIGNSTGSTANLQEITLGTGLAFSGSSLVLTSGAGVTSVNVSGGTTGLTTSGGPITSSGTITIAGTLVPANGGTGTATAFTQGSIVFAGASGIYTQNNAKLFWNNTSFGLGIGTASPVVGGGVTIAPAAVTTGSPSLLTITGPADTTLTASEFNDVNFNLGRTVQFTGSTGFTTQRAAVIQAPTYAFASATGTIINAATLAITDGPIAGTNAAITNRYALWVQNGTTQLTSQTGDAALITSNNGGGTVQVWMYGGGQIAKITGPANFSLGSAERPQITATGGYSSFGGLNINLADDNLVRWTNFGDSYTAYDTAVARNGVSILEVNNATPGQWAILKVGTHDSSTNATSNGLIIGHQSTGTPATGLGSGILFNIDSTTTSDRNAAKISANWTTATDASRSAQLSFSVVSSAGALTDNFDILGSGAFNAPIGYYLAVPTADYQVHVTLGDVALSTSSGQISLVNDGGDILLEATAAGGNVQIVSDQNNVIIAATTGQIILEPLNFVSVTAGMIQDASIVQTTAQFDKTTSTSLANITGLSINVVAGVKYAFEAKLFVSADATGGHKYAIGGTATATIVKYQINSINNSASTLVVTSTQTSLGGSAGQAGATVVYTEIKGTITVNAAGTLTVQFAQNASNGTSSVLTESSFKVTPIQ